MASTSFDTTIPNEFKRLVEKEPKATFYEYRDPSSGTEKGWLKVPRCDAQRSAEILASYLVSIGVRRGDMVAIFSNNRPESLLAKIALLQLGATVVPILPLTQAPQVQRMIRHCGAEIVFAENQGQVRKLVAANAENAPIYRQIISFEKVSNVDCSVVHHFPEIMEQHEQNGFAADLPAIDPDDRAALLSTSGSSGDPKLVSLSHRNLMASVDSVENLNVFRAGEKAAFVLPDAHSYPFLMTVIASTRGLVLSFPTIADRLQSRFRPSQIKEDICDSNSQYVPIIPHFLSQIRKDLLEFSGRKIRWQKKHVAQDLGERIAGSLVKAKSNVMTAEESGTSAGIKDKVLAAAMFFARPLIVRRAFGNQVRMIVTGGAKLPPAVGSFFDKVLGVPVAEGYGATEGGIVTHCGGITRPEYPKYRVRYGVVGPPVKNTMQRINAEGILEVGGPQVSRGYYNNAEFTAAAFTTDGYFCTGDLAKNHVDDAIEITGRASRDFKNSLGEPVAPELAERRLIDHPILQQAVVFGLNQPMNVAVVVPRESTLKQLAVQQNVEASSLLTSRKIIQSIISYVNEPLVSKDRVAHLIFADEPFSIENGLLTPSGKVSVTAVVKRYQVPIARYFADLEKIS